MMTDLLDPDPALYAVQRKMAGAWLWIRSVDLSRSQYSGRSRCSASLFHCTCTFKPCFTYDGKRMMMYVLHASILVHPPVP